MRQPGRSRPSENSLQSTRKRASSSQLRVAGLRFQLFGSYVGEGLSKCPAMPGGNPAHCIGARRRDGRLGERGCAHLVGGLARGDRSHRVRAPSPGARCPLARFLRPIRMHGSPALSWMRWLAMRSRIVKPNALQSQSAATPTSE